MPSARPNGQLQNKNHDRVQRTDSVKSERSDKRVSFNKDVGVKHIPRGQKNHNKQIQKLLVTDLDKDEWASCASVRREPPPLSADEKEKEAIDLVRLLDHVACTTGPQAPTHPKYTSRSLDRLVYKNNKNDLINNTQNNLVNSASNISSPRVKAYPASRTANPINRKKSDVNKSVSSPSLEHNHPYTSNYKEFIRRSISPHSSPESSEVDVLDTRLYGFKSVPDLSATLYYDNKDAYKYHFQELMSNHQDDFPSKSVDNLLVGNTPNILYKNLRDSNSNTYRSADNLIEVSHYPDYPFPGYKSADNLLSPTYSNIEAIKSNSMASTSESYKPKVGNMIKRFNAESDNLRVRSHLLDTVGGLTEPNNHRNHNHNQPFSYIDPPLSSVQEIRKISPPRETKPVDAMYAQVNKQDRHTNFINRNFEQNYKNTQPEHEYSAKIIITDERDKNNFRYNDDEYETYEVQDSKLTKVSNNKRLQDYGLRVTSDDLMDEYKNLSYNNINMSSVGVQTDALPKAPNRNRKISKFSTSPTRETPNKKEFDSYLVSSSLVRQVNHGFGRTDRSPSPPMKVRGTRNIARPVVPLLSDTSDSEADYRIRTDPLAKIRDQVMIREKLQEDKEAEEAAERDHRELKRREILSYNPNEMRPLTIDEVDALSLEVDENGRKSLVVARTSGNSSSNRNINSMQRDGNSKSREKSNSRSRNDSTSRSNINTLNRSNTNSLARNTSQKSEKINNERVSRYDKTQKEKSSIFSHASPTRLFSSLDRSRKNNSDKEKLSKDKKENKDKKKKRIKIKFFYDPRPQDSINEDPLSRFTEYKGTSSDERSSPSNNNYRQNNSTDYRKKQDSSRSRSRENINHRSSRDLRDHSKDSRHYASSQNNNRYDRERSRDNSRDHSRDHTPRREVKDNRIRSGQRGRSASERSSNNEMRDDKTSDYQSQEISKRSIDRRDTRSTDRKRDSSYERRDNRRIERSIDKKDYRSLDRREDRSRRDNYDNRSRNGHIHHEVNRDTKYNGTREVHRTSDSNRYDDYEDCNIREASDARQSRTLSEKYKSGATLYDPQHDEPVHSSDGTETVSHQERVMRQRNKFLSTFISEGRAKSSPNLKNTNKNNTLNSAAKTPTRNNDGILVNKTSKSSLDLHRNIKYSTENLKEKTVPKITIDESPDAPSSTKKTAVPKKKKKRMWPWSFLGLRGSSGKKEALDPHGGLHPPRASSRASSRASRASSRASSARGSHRPRRPSVRAAKIRRDGPDGKLWTSKNRLPPAREPNWESVTLNRVDMKTRRETKDIAPRRDYGSSQHLHNHQGRKSSAESSDSYKSPRRDNQVGRTSSFKQRYFGDSDGDSRRGRVNLSSSDYRSLPNRPSRVNISRQNSHHRRFGRNGREISPTAGGSAGSSLQSSESEADSRQGSHASRASKASHVSTESNRSVYLHATAVADIPVHRMSEDIGSDKPPSVQSKRVARSFSLVAPWKPKHYKDKIEVDYDNRDSRYENHRVGRGALPPRPPRRAVPENLNSKKVSRSQSVYKDSKLAGWLRRRRHKEIKGI